MATKAVHENKIPYLGMTTYDGILIQRVVLVMTSPSTQDLTHEQQNCDISAKDCPSHPILDSGSKTSIFPS